MAPFSIFDFEQVNSCWEWTDNVLVIARKYLKLDCSDTSLRPYQTSMMGLLRENSEQLLAVKYFSQKAPP